MHEKHEIKKYRLLSYVLMAILPIILYVSSKNEYINYGFVSCIFIIISIMIFLLRYETKIIQARQWIPLVVMAALAALSSNLFFGQGPWTPWQMFSWGLIGFLAG